MQFYCATGGSFILRCGFVQILSHQKLVKEEVNLFVVEDSSEFW